MSQEPGKPEKSDQEFDEFELEQWADDGGAVYGQEIGPEAQPELDIPQTWDEGRPDEGIR